MPAEHVLTETFSSLLMAAQAKLGRNDARLLIDTAGQAFAHVRQYLSDAAANQIEQALNQVRMAQVQAEQAAATSGRTEENDLPHKPAAPAGPSGPSGPSGPAASSGPAATSGQSQTSKLWIPGR